jgi:hypothetical protein
MIASSSKELAPIVEKYATPSDYVSARLVQKDPVLAARIPKSQAFWLPASVAGVQQYCSTGNLVLYDGEHWSATPADEKADMPGAIGRAKALAKTNGCVFGIAPDGQYAGLIPKTCTADVNRAIHRQIDWDDIALYNIQAQRLLSDDCASQGGVDNYVSFVSQVTREVHQKNPNAKVSAQISLRYTPPDRAIAVINRLKGVVDGFYIAYPVGQNLNCQYCTPQNLAQVLAAIKS